VTPDSAGGDGGRPRREIVVIGASAGGVGALAEIARGLPKDLGAAVFVVLHLPEGGRSYLAGILDRAGPLPASPALDGAAIETGRIYVAPPDHHLVLDPGATRVLRGPKVNGHRPSVDVLFHSAARVYGSGVVGVVLTGTLRDGTLGLRAIKRRHGVAIVQADAPHPGMPMSALEHAEVDAAIPLREIAERLTMVVERPQEAAVPEDDRIDQTELESGFDISEVREAPGEPTAFRCPECGGALWELDDGDASSYACHVGHTFSVDSMLEEQGNAVERALWSAVRMLEERASLVEGLAQRMEQRGHSRSPARWEAKGRVAREQAALIRRALLEAPEEGDVDEPERAAS
jgi:two-component system, chemotaxis family, protein-glutamate methylesterase/glutaminase